MIVTSLRRSPVGLALCCLSPLTTAAAPAGDLAVPQHYADIALAAYEDALAGARRLTQAVEVLGGSQRRPT